MIMIDIVNEINIKMNSLKLEKEALKKEYEIKAQKIDEEIIRYASCINVLEDVVSSIVCPNCGCSGAVRYTDAAGDVDTKKCTLCGGRGVKH